MQSLGITFRGPEIDDSGLLSSLPYELQDVVAETNGFILWHGALHVRGICSEPRWHSLKHAWHGDRAFHLLYDAITPEDIPFAQDCVGDQFLLREGHIIRLFAETGEVEGVALDLVEFFEKVEKDPQDFLAFSPDHPLKPGELLHAYPPYCIERSSDGYSLRPCPAHEVIQVHAAFSKQIAALPEGTRIKINPEETNNKSE